MILNSMTNSVIVYKTPFSRRINTVFPENAGKLGFTDKLLVFRWVLVVLH